MDGSKIIIEKGNLKFTFLNSGDIYEISHKNTMINQLLGNPIDGSLNNIYLRIYKEEGIKAIPLLGVKSNSKTYKNDSQVIWKGSAGGIDYKVTFTLTNRGVWFWDVVLDGQNIDADIIYGQDLGLADKGAVRSNEAYMSQYIDHKVFEDKDRGYVVCSRQNQPMTDGFPYIQQGSLEKTIGYSTDGFQFYGLSYKTTNKPEVLTKPNLANENYQYEFAFTALQSKKITLSGEKKFVFYGLFNENYPSAITSLEFENKIKSSWDMVKNSEQQNLELVDKPNSFPIVDKTLETLSMTKEEIDKYFLEKCMEEKDGDSLLSFFTKTYEHIVLKEKEQLVERPHGHILMSGNNDKLKEDTISTTSYMQGIFNAQLTIGNTSMNKMLSDIRNPLNIMKTSGQRIYIEIDGEYHLLTMPSMFEIGFNYTRWYYKTKKDMIIITNFTTTDSSEVQLQLKSTKGKKYNYLVTNQITMNNNEYEAPFKVKRDGNTIEFFADKKADSKEKFPELSYKLHVEGGEFSLESIDSASLEILKIEDTKEWTIGIQGYLYKENKDWQPRDFTMETEKYRKFFNDTMNGFNLSNEKGTTEEIEKINITAWWYTHNMLVHFSSPRGLEQYKGAAWGTRDVCQGPFEYFMATQKYVSVKEIILKVFEHQYKGIGNWPQWFMFDKYESVQQLESHGDIIVWPLKVIGDYLESTKDYTILEETVPYTNRENFEFTDKEYTILEHIEKAIGYMKREFIHDTYLSSYGDGDWDDTLQPANQQLKKFMVSSWTVALTYQALNKLSKVLYEYDKQKADKLKTLSSKIKKDYNNYINSSEILPGFIYMEEPNKVEFMLHPTDSTTGIKYRLLPMMRGIISEILTPEEANKHYDIIKRYLYFPDGVRLMDRPAEYKGGVSVNFKRAEQASNFGREIGLNYIHADIRFAEAMAKMGHNDEVWRALSVINPVGIRKVVPNAEIRQSNAYFSSSDGKFNTRYKAQENFEGLRDGSIKVKGGWRIYSSGPGIYMNQLISSMLGIREKGNNMIIDPVLPDKFDGLQFDFKFMNYPIRFIYHLNQKDRKVLVNGENVKVNKIKNPYRQGGFEIDYKILESLLTNNVNVIDIYL